MPTAGAPKPPSNKGVRPLFREFGVRHQIAGYPIALSVSLLALALLGGDSLAQEPLEAPAAPCNVVTGSADVNDQGEFVRPPATIDDCAAVEEMVEKFLAMSRGDFRRVDVVDGIPGPVSVHIGRVRPWGGSVSELPTNRRHGVTWLSDRLVVVVIEASDFAGQTTTVIIADLETRQVCEFARWPGAEDPRNLTIPEIQQVLDSGLLGDRSTPSCRLSSLPIE